MERKPSPRSTTPNPPPSFATSPRHPASTQSHPNPSPFRQLEFGRLAHLTGRPHLAAAADAGVDAVLAANPGPLYPTSVDLDTGEAEYESSHGVGGRSDSWYEYLLKAWILGKHAATPGSPAAARGETLRAAWVAAMDAVLARLAVRTPAGQVYLTSDSGEQAMEHLACFLPGNLALGVEAGAVGGARARRYLAAAKDIARTCVAAAQATATGLQAEVTYFRPEAEPGYPPQSLLRPETIESLYMLHRVTGDPVYQEWGWRLFRAFELTCRVSTGGYSGVHDVDADDPTLDDTQPSFWLAETLKYLWLLFGGSGGGLPPGEWVFNTEAHPLRVLPPAVGTGA